MSTKKSKVKIFNTLLQELHNKYADLYKNSNTSEEDYNFVLDIEKVKYKKDLELFVNKYSEKDVYDRNEEIFPVDEVFWEYFPKLYSLGFKNKKDAKKFIESSDLSVTPPTLNSDSFSGLESQMKQMMSNPKFMNLASKLTEEIEKDPELIKNITSMFKN